ncbi:hypothetical protein BSKO_01183 [Bryopsis sp. KO-2023]|nr:hypothetical protein BSKO_01183 [Bryopsis sp. KO-2023]
MSLVTSRSGLVLDRGGRYLKNVPAFRKIRSTCRGRVAPGLRSNANHKRATKLFAQAPTTESVRQPEQDPDVEDVEGKEDVFEVAPGVLCFRATCRQRLKFAIQYGLQRGTTDNSYLVKGDSRETTALIDIPYGTFADDYIRTVQKTVGFGSIGHLVMTHVDVKGIPTLQMVLEKILESGATNVTMHLSAAGINFLRNVMGETEKGTKLLESCTLTVASPGSVLDLGDGKQLEFIRTATARWPDLLAVYLPSSKTLFSSKFFSGHAAPDVVGTEGAFDERGWQEFGNDWKYYFDCMFAPTASQVGKTLKLLNLQSTPVSSKGSKSFWDRLYYFLSGESDPSKAKPGDEASSDLRSRPVSYLCPMHGPVIKNSVNEVIEEYIAWVADKDKILSRVAVFYASAYGHTATLAQALSRGISKAGVGVDTVNLEVAAPEEVVAAITNASGFVIGSPTLGGHMPTQVQSALGTILRESKAKQLPCGVFGSFGWSGEAVDEMDQRLRDGGFTFGFEPIKVKFRPTSKDLQVSEESGTDLAQLILKKEKQKRKRTASASKSRGASEAAQATGRVVGALCVLTTRDGDAEGGMLASWISQASFDPPGLTVAVKKDRAMENLMLPGNRFNVNVLAEGREKPTVKAMLKPFKPGEDRFADMEIERSEGTGCVVFPDAVSLMECSVVTRMEAGDHWVVYASVQEGKVMDPKAVSAVHHRKVGTSY